jgi:hypothetical protein
MAGTNPNAASINRCKTVSIAPNPSINTYLIRFPAFFSNILSLQWFFQKSVTSPAVPLPFLKNPARVRGIGMRRKAEVALSF